MHFPNNVIVWITQHTHRFIFSFIVFYLISLNDPKSSISNWIIVKCVFLKIYIEQLLIFSDWFSFYFSSISQFCRINYIFIPCYMMVQKKGYSVTRCSDGRLNFENILCKFTPIHSVSRMHLLETTWTCNTWQSPSFINFRCCNLPHDLVFKIFRKKKSVVSTPYPFQSFFNLFNIAKNHQIRQNFRNPSLVIPKVPSKQFKRDPSIPPFTSKTVPHHCFRKGLSEISLQQSYSINSKTSYSHLISQRERKSINIWLK